MSAYQRRAIEEARARRAMSDRPRFATEFDRVLAAHGSSAYALSGGSADVSIYSYYLTGKRHPTRASVAAIVEAVAATPEEAIRLYVAAGYVPTFPPERFDAIVAAIRDTVEGRAE